MQTQDTKTNLLGLERRALEAFFTDMGEKAFRASQVMKWVYHRGVDDFEAMTDLSRALRERLAAVAEVALPRVVIDQPSRDGSRKWLLELTDGNCVEAVFIPEEGRGTLCVSSQVGCALNCSICSTARQGFNRNLDAGEIVGQVVVAMRELGIPENKGERVITNIVLMGMGEPLLNLDHLLPALRLMIDDLGFGVSRRRVTVSTAGVVPGIERLREEGLDVSLAVSLHATDDALRDELVPINRKYPIAELLEACRRYVAGKPHRRVTFEYCMLEGRNDSPEHARQLARLLRRVPSKINLIPFNAFPGSDYRRPSQAAIDRFREVLLAADITAVTRRPRGEDIDAACGQLVGKVADRTRRRDRLEGAGRLAS